MAITTSAALAAIIDHTILRPDASDADVDQFCAEALQWAFASVCVNGHIEHWPIASRSFRDLLS